MRELIPREERPVEQTARNNTRSQSQLKRRIGSVRGVDVGAVSTGRIELLIDCPLGIQSTKLTCNRYSPWHVPLRIGLRSWGSELPQHRIPRSHSPL